MPTAAEPHMMATSCPMGASGAAPATSERPVDEEHDDRADDGHDDALDVEARHAAFMQNCTAEPAPHDRPDDAQENRPNQPFVATNDHVGEEAGDRAEHDPGDDAHLVPPSYVVLAGLASLAAAPGLRR